MRGMKGNHGGWTRKPGVRHALVALGFLLIAITPPLGAFMYRVYTRERIGRVEGALYRVIGVDPAAEQSWRRYAASVLWFSAISMVFVYAIFAMCATAVAILSELVAVPFVVAMQDIVTAAELPPAIGGPSPDPHPPKR